MTAARRRALVRLANRFPGIVLEVVLIAALTAALVWGWINVGRW